MKVRRSLMVGLIAMTGSAFAVPPNYDGSSEPGVVRINDSSTVMTGSFGVRFRPLNNRHLHSYMATRFDGETIWFIGYDSDSARAFSCWVFNGRSQSYPWDNFLDIAVNAGNGAMLEVERYGNSEPGFEFNCKRAALRKNSRQTH